MAGNGIQFGKNASVTAKDDADIVDKAVPEGDSISVDGKDSQINSGSHNGESASITGDTKTAAVLTNDKTGSVAETGLGPQTSAKDVGIDVKAAQEDDVIGEVLAEESAATQGGGGDNGEYLYSSHPIQNLTLGPWSFENTLLKVRAEDHDKFLKMLDNLPPQDRIVIRQLDVQSVNKIVESRLAQATQNIDSSVGRDAMAELRASIPKLGTEAIDKDVTLGHVAQSQRDGNEERPVLTEKSDNQE